MDLTAAIATTPIPSIHTITDTYTDQCDVQRVRAALDKLRRSRADNYHEWLNVAIALKSESDDLFPEFDRWSRQSAKYGDTRRTWDSIKPKPGGITIASLYYWAEQDAPSDKPKATLVPVNAHELPKLYAELPTAVIHGLLNVGDVLNVISGPKNYKSFFVMQLAVCVAAGIPFLGFPTVQGRVLIVDNELRGNVFWRRMRRMVDAMGLDWDKVTTNIDVLLLRGKLEGLNAITDLVRSTPGKYSLVIVDTLYKALRGIDENSNSDIAAVYCLLDGAAEESRSAFGIVHHTSKGSQAGKSISDIGSGAGAQSRSADVHAAILPHTEEGYHVLGVIARAQPPIAPMVLKFDYPLWKVAADKAPTVAAPNKKREPTIDEFLATLPTEPAPKTETLEYSRLILLCSKQTIAALFAECVKRKLVEQITPANRREKHLIRRIETTTEQSQSQE